MDITKFANVVAVSPGVIEIDIVSTAEYERLDKKLEIGSFLKIFSDGEPAVIAVVRSYRLKDSTTHTASNSGAATVSVKFTIETQPVGTLDGGKFSRGGTGISIPPQKVEIADRQVLHDVYSAVSGDEKFDFASLPLDSDVRVTVDGNKFFGRHIGVVGSTGSGKSGTVAKILQRATRSETSAPLNNSHVVIFDVHGEYAPAFPEAAMMDVSSFALPYWLMNSEELVDMFIESNEENSHNQISQFRQAVLENKRRHARRAGHSPDLVTHDSSCYFSLQEVITYLVNQNTEIVYKGINGPHQPKLFNGAYVANTSDYYFDNVQTFVAPKTSGDDKATVGPFYGEFSRLIMRLQARLDDSRLNFLLAPTTQAGNPYATADKEALLRSYLGYTSGSEHNVSIVDLSGVPFEVLSVVVSLLSRMVFAFNFQYQQTVKATVDARPFPVMLVLEEAHNYVPRGDSAKFKSVKRSVERIAKEGRKYGISLMVVSQRPSEVSETIFSQCGNFVAMRLSNPADQNYVRRLLPDSLGVVTESLPTLRQREALLVGDAISVPSIVYVDELQERPHSRDVPFLEEWRKEWHAMEFANYLEP